MTEEKTCYDCKFYSYTTDGWEEEPYCEKLNEWIYPFSICKYYTEDNI